MKHELTGKKKGMKKRHIPIELLVVKTSSSYWPYDGRVFLSGELDEAKEHLGKTLKTKWGRENCPVLISAKIVI